MASSFQNPPGTRDFYPAEMALRRYIEEAWRRVSQRHGFVEIDGPTFEYLDLYKVKSGEEIVSQLFHFESRGEDKTAFALRPEFTPTLARMIAARANTLPRPVKWFSIPRCYRAERPQKGRLREFFQWNADMLGGDTPEQRRQYDLEIAALCLDGLRELGLTNTDIQFQWNDRTLVEKLLAIVGIPESRYALAFHLLDRLTKLSAEQRGRLYQDHGVSDRERTFFEQLAAGADLRSAEFRQALGGSADLESFAAAIADQQQSLERTLGLMGLAGFARYDPSMVRGLAYYTGFVFEIAASRGEHRAIAGGGRYDRLIEMFGGPSLPACGFGLGDVVLANLLADLGRLPDFSRGMADVQVFVVNALPASDEALRLLGALRATGIRAAGSYKATKNIGKLIQEAAAGGARVALILAPAEMERGLVKLKDMVARRESEVPVAEAVAAVRRALAG